MENNNIIIRQLSDLQSELLEKYMQKFGHKTRSKAVLSMIEHSFSNYDLIERQRNLITDLEEENESLKASIADFIKSFNNLSSLAKKK